MFEDDEPQARNYLVVVNHEEQYALWPDDLEIPAGWSPAGHHGDKESCMAFVRRVWPDIRPLSVRRRLEALRKDDSEHG